VRSGALACGKPTVVGECDSRGALVVGACGFDTHGYLNCMVILCSNVLWDLFALLCRCSYSEYIRDLSSAHSHPAMVRPCGFTGLSPRPNLCLYQLVPTRVLENQCPCCVRNSALDLLVVELTTTRSGTLSTSEKPIRGRNRNNRQPPVKFRTLTTVFQQIHNTAVKMEE
jgi:hypothetical protein